MTLKAWADDVRLITCVMDSDFYPDDAQAFSVDGKELKIIDRKCKDSQTVYSCQTDFDIDPDQEYTIQEIHHVTAVLRYRFICKSEYFNERYKYDGKLGIDYSKEATSFYLWAPTSQEAYVELYREKEPELFRMTKKGGVYSVTIASDLDRVRYRYLTKSGGKPREFYDPYAVALDPCCQYSIVIDTSAYDGISGFENGEDPIIYEISVRDFTSDPYTAVVNKSRYLALTEKAATDRNTNCGIEYLKELGISHVQIMPVQENGTVDDLAPEKYYNWGYDPISFSTVEGSYSTDPANPYARIEELNRMVNQLHQNGIGVIYDMIYNHVYLPVSNVINKAVPYYYYRYDENSEMSNASGCGNDLDTKLPMVRHLILNSVETMIRRFKADGIRLDLMGLIDIETTRKIVQFARNIKPDFAVYGEGWNMPTYLKDEEKTSLYNQKKDLDVAYFNDYFRDSLRGGFDNVPGYLLGNSQYGRRMINSICGIYPCQGKDNIYPDKKHIINYVECHDNVTLYDKLNGFEQYQKDLIIKSSIAILLLSVGTPMIHGGLEFERTKYGYDNTYNLSEKINRFDYVLKDRNQWLVDYTKELIKLRKRLNLYRLSLDEVKERYQCNLVYDTDVKIRINCEGLNEFRELYLIVNNHDYDWMEELHDDYVLLLNDEGTTDMTVSRAFVKQHSVILLGKY